MARNFKSLNRFKAATFFFASAWFIAYCGTTQSPNPLVLCLGFFVILPITLLQGTWLFARIMAIAGGRLLVKKKYDLARRCGRYGTEVCSWWANWAKLGGVEYIGLNRLYISNLLILSDSDFAGEQFDDAIATRKQIVELAAEAGFDCDAGNACDYLAFFYRRKNDKIHAKHWAERAIAYYSKPAENGCRCRRKHDHLLGKHAALHALNAVESQLEGFSNAALNSAHKAEALLAGAGVARTDVALKRLMDFYYKGRDWDGFTSAAERFLKGKWTDEEKSSLVLAGQAHQRLGIIYAEAGKTERAEASFIAGIDFAKRAGRQDLLVKLEAALADLRKPPGIGEEKAV